MKIKYTEHKFSPSGLQTIEIANRIIAEYQSQGFDLTLRQLYYQFVSRDLIRNSQREYKRLGDIINNGRLAGLISWEAIVDRTRNLRSLPHWNSPREIVEACSRQFRIDMWDNQRHRLEVWIEKDALVGVIERVCQEFRVPYFSCRGYTSQSEMWSAAMRLKGYLVQGQQPLIIHLGDHDPSGIDMTRDIDSRINMFLSADDLNAVEIKRIALNFDQIEQFDPPPNPAKITDPRAEAYVSEHGTESWELDALDPRQIDKLIRETVADYRDVDAWDEARTKEANYRRALIEISKHKSLKGEDA